MIHTVVLVGFLQLVTRGRWWTGLGGGRRNPAGPGRAWAAGGSSGNQSMLLPECRRPQDKQPPTRARWLQASRIPMPIPRWPPVSSPLLLRCWYMCCAQPAYQTTWHRGVPCGHGAGPKSGCWLLLSKAGTSRCLAKAGVPLLHTRLPMLSLALNLYPPCHAICIHSRPVLLLSALPSSAAQQASADHARFEEESSGWPATHTATASNRQASPVCR